MRQQKMTQLGVEAWLTGRRRSQGGARESLALLEIDDMDGRLKMNPLINWPLENVWAHIRTHNLPYNTLHDQVPPRLSDIFRMRSQRAKLFPVSRR